MMSINDRAFFQPIERKYRDFVKSVGHQFMTEQLAPEEEAQLLQYIEAYQSIVDLGSGLGRVPIWVKSRFSQCNVIAIERDLDLYQRLAAKIETSGLDIEVIYSCFVKALSSITCDVVTCLGNTYGALFSPRIREEFWHKLKCSIRTSGYLIIDFMEQENKQSKRKKLVCESWDGSIFETMEELANGSYAHLPHFYPSKTHLREITRQHGFQVARSIGVGADVEGKSIFILRRT
jgi:precorrin-6B methylase 2